ncbi:MAG: IS3 family transposase [bacterium]|nr:IS3 family transposase [bacterium]
MADRGRHTPEQIVRKLRGAGLLLGGGASVADVARHLGVSEQTFHRWRNQCGGMRADDVERLKELEAENARLKRIVADKELEIDAWKEIGPGEMVGPPQRRRAVEMLQERLGVSQRRACRIVGRHRSTQRYEPAEPGPDWDLRAELREFAGDCPRWGYRRAHAVLRREGWRVNRERVQRLWREEGLRVPPAKRERRRAGGSDADAGLLAAERPDHVWALDFQFDATASGRKFKILHVIDEFARESSADLVDHSIDADATVACLDKAASARGRRPELARCDNGPEPTANALRDWCQLTNTKTSCIDPGSPWQNPWAESHGSRMRDELLAIEQLDSLLEAQVLVADWRSDYNTYRPHSALGMLTPAEYADQRAKNNPKKLSQQADQKTGSGQRDCAVSRCT